MKAGSHLQHDGQEKADGPYSGSFPQWFNSFVDREDDCTELGQADCAIDLLGYSARSPFPDEQRELEEALAEVSQVAGNDALHRIASTRQELDPSRLKQLLDQLEELLDSTPISTSQNGPLSPRELEVLLLLANGRSNRAIADKLSISQRTVENHVAHIPTKLDLDSRAAAAAWAVRNNLA
jgi:DNA-binding CsgD family transcriptional regulator